MPKFEYEKIIQQNCAGYWEDVSHYPANSQGIPVDRELLRHDLKEYRLTGYPTRCIFRRTRLTDKESA